MSSNRFTPAAGRLAGCDGFVTKLNDFMRTPGYVIALSVLTVICNLLALELVLYTIFILTAIFTALRGSDFLPIMPLVVLSYIAPSPSNNPGSASNKGSIFLPRNGGIYLIVLAALLVISLVYRLVTDDNLGKGAFFKKKRPLLGGMLILSGSYLLSGVGMNEYGLSSVIFLLVGVMCLLLMYLGCLIHEALVCKLPIRSSLPGKNEVCVGISILLVVYGTLGGVFGLFGNLPARNLLFAIIQCLAVMAMYYIFSGAVKWQNVPKSYLAWVGMCAGFVVVPQLAENYLSGRIFMDGTHTIDRELIYAGWGMHNNIGGMMTFMLPFPFYLACTQKRGWIYNLLGTLLLGAILLSCSRTSIMVALAIYAVCITRVLKNREQRKQNLWVCGIVYALALVACVVLFRKLLKVFDLFIEEIFIMSERDNLVGYGMKQYLNHPIFGGSFFPQGEYVPWDWSTSAAFSSFFPPRWHNTIIQMLASCGIVGLVCYLWHRYQTVRMILENRTVEKTFIGLFVAALLLCSLMDCHFFNVGPVLFYSMALAYAENIHESKL